MADIPESTKSRAAFALAASKIDRDARLSDLTDAEIDALIAATRTAPPAMDREAVAAIIDPDAFDPTVEEEAVYALARRRLWLRRSEALNKAAAILSTLSADAIRQGEGLSDADLKDAVTELLSHRGESPYRILRGGSALWETWVPSFRAAIRYLPATPASHASDGGKA